MKFRYTVLAFTISALFNLSALAAVSADEAKQLGTTLTPWGAEIAGNKEGTIPAYTGEKVKIPAAYNPKEPGTIPDPFGDKPLFTITAQNMAQYAENLTEGQKTMLKTYPSYRMDVYQSHRTRIYPKYVVDNTLKNATACKTSPDGLRLVGCYAGVPFPIPKTGNEVVWNHNTRYFTEAFAGNVEAWVVDASGKPIFQGQIVATEHYPFWDPSRTGPAAPDSIYWKLRFDYSGPARKVGEKYVIIDALDPINPGRRAFLYVPGQRRVKLSPDLAYDTPSPASGGSSTMDEQTVFLGAQDRYNMKLVGKKEIFMMHNSNKTYDYHACPSEKGLTKNFINPDCVRWELHRAYVVEATLKSGVRHVLPKRVMYFDEDTPGAATGDSYDASGKLYRVDYAPHVVNYAIEPQASSTEQAFTYDLQTGIVSVSSWFGCKGCGWVAIKPPLATFYSPEALAGEGIR